MSLKNIIKLPTRRVQLPKSKDIINVRPFTVKEQNTIQMGMNSDDSHTISSTLKNVLEACISEDIKVNEIPLIDVEFIFLQLLKISSGRYIEVGYKCLSEMEDGSECGWHNNVNFDLNETSFVFSESPDSKKFQITEEVYLEFAKINANDLFDSFGSMAVQSAEPNGLEEAKDKYVSSLIKIYDGDEVHNTKDFSSDEVWEVIEWIPTHVIEEIDEFITDVDRISLVKEFKCQKCGTDHKIEHEGLEDFLV